MDRYFVCHSGSLDPNDEKGMVGRVYVWTGKWLRSPKQVAKRDRDPIMELRPLWGDQFIVRGDIGSYMEVTFAEPPT